MTEVRRGYKQTEVGVIPEDWTANDLSHVCLLQRGFDITESSRVPGDVPVYSSSGLAYFHNKAMVNPPGVVTGRKGILGKVFLIKEPFWPHDTRLWVKDFKGNDPTFVALVLQDFDLQRLDAATSVPTLNRNNLAGHYVAVPDDAAEQKAIAEAVSDADALIGSLEQLLTTKRQIKQGAMQELLTGKKRLPGFKQLRNKRSLEKISAFITKGSTPTTYGFSWADSGVIFLRSECVSERGLDLSESMFISSPAHATLSRSEVRGGDILMTITGNVGRVVMLDPEFPEANINQHIARIRVSDDSVDPKFVFHVLTAPGIRNYYNSITTGQAYPQISLTQVRTAEIGIPSLPEQTAIASVLSDMDSEISALEAKLAKARKIKQGMMQNLLTGKIRLV